MSKIFLSYRRDDSAATCGRIYERLAAHFGRDAIFKDVDDIPYGVRFPDYLAEQLRGCRVELVIIGRFWLTLTTPAGTRRLDAPGDFVRTEVETGLRDGLIVVPVLVDNASMPHAEDLPASIRELVEFNGAQVRYDPDFDTDMQRLIRQLERWLGAAPAGTHLTPPPDAGVGASGGRPPTATPAPPTDPQAAAVADLMPGIQDAYQRQEWHRVIDKADALLAEAPDTTPASVYRLLGEARAETGDFVRARQTLDTALARGYADVATWTLAARVCLRVNDPTAAAGHLKRALARVDAPAERLPLLQDYCATLISLKQWDELLRRADEGTHLAPDDVFWPRTRLRALTELHRDGEALALLRTLTGRPDATLAWWVLRARLARSVGGESDAANAEIQAALDAAARLAGPNDATVAAVRRELFPPPPPPIPPEQFPERLASLGFVPHKGKDPQTGKEAAYILPPMASVPAGQFQMGKTNPRDPDGQYDGPARTASTSAFAIARYPITVAEYACFVRAGHQEPPQGFYGVDWRTQLTRLDHPVTCVSWHDATAYAKWLADLTNQPWRLPSEEEWEKAARWDPRTGASRIYPWGDAFDQTRCNTSESGIKTTTPVGKYGASGASPVGAEEMAGNVWEWTNSKWDNSTEDRVLRGGSWYFDHQNARAAYRDHVGPGSSASAAASASSRLRCGLVHESTLSVF